MPTRFGLWAAHAVMVAGMVTMIAAPGTMLAVSAAYLTAAAVLARSARTAGWAREAIVDLWAMTLLTLSVLAGPSSEAAKGAALAPASASVSTAPAHPIALALHHGAPTTVFEVMMSAVVVVAVWLLARAALAAGARRRRASIRHSLVTAAMAAAQLVVMLAVH